MTAELDTMARVVQTTHNAVVITDPQLRITWVNAGFTRMSGYTLEEALGKTPGELLGSRKNQPEVIQVLMDAAAAGKACRVELVNCAKDGHEYWLDTDVQPTFDDKGVLAGFMEIGTEITAQKHSQMGLEAAQRDLTAMADRLNLAVEGGNDGLWDWMDLATDAQWWSPSYYALLGYTPDELPATGSNYVSLIHPDLVADASEALQLTLHHGKVYDKETLLRTKTNGYRWFRSRAKVYRDAKGNPIRIAGSAQDVHDRKLAEAEVKRAGALLRGSIDALDDACALFDPQDKLVMCNRRFLDVHATNPLPITPGVKFVDILLSAAESRTVPEAAGREEPGCRNVWVCMRAVFHQPARCLTTDHALYRHPHAGRHLWCLRWM
jgi:PAS domain S-box-containing protein